jgi:hypothetical protein
VGPRERYTYELTWVDSAGRITEVLRLRKTNRTPVRIKQLLEQDPEYDEKDRSNYETILNDYQTGSIKHSKSGFGYFYYAGHRVMGEVELAKFSLFDHFDEWIEKHGWEGRSWLERVVILT